MYVTIFVIPNKRHKAGFQLYFIFLFLKQIIGWIENIMEW